MKTKLCLCVSVALGITVVNVHAGELTISPSATLKAYQVDIDGEPENNQRNEAVFASELVTTSDYESNLYSSSLKVEWVDYQHTESRDVELNYVDVTWGNTWSFLEERLTAYADYSRKHDYLTDFQGNFDSQLFGYENNILMHEKGAGLAYLVPETKDLDGVVKIDYSDSSSSSRGEEDSEAGDVSTSFIDSGNVTGYAKLGQYDNDPDTMWYADLTRTEYYRNGDDVYDSIESSIKGRLPLYGHLHLVATGYYGETDSSSLIDLEGDSDTQSLKTNGIGLAWKRGERFYVEVTHEWNHSNDSTFLAGVASWQIAPNWSASWEKQKRVYSDVESASLIYANERHTFTASHNETIEVRRQNQKVLVGETLYVCDIEDAATAVCFEPESDDYLVGDDQFTYTASNYAYPIVERLVFVEETVAEWKYDNLSQWRHIVNVEWREESSMESESDASSSTLGKEVFEVDVDGEWTLDDVSAIKPAFYFADTKSAGLGRTVERQASLVYEHELNRNSEVSVGVKHTNIDSFRENFKVDGYSVFATYTYHFGKNNKSRRGLYPER
ncbi:hypothetical protein [Alteromonas sp. 14N.309.X.WAT.G.H12]|uniref:hypothetical protein n=1 Tax=Alteromonas sp. 14N.309.X.WAT.G.H12 TaxID=3120824 RepID=UPI002FD3FC1C